MEHTGDIRILIERSRAGETGAFSELYNHLINRVYTYVRYRTGSEERATDITQDVFIDLYKALPKFTYRSVEQFYGFVFVIVKRKLARHYGDKHMNIAELDEATVATPELNNLLSDELHRALNQLDPQSREIVILHHWSRYTFGEIAELVSMTETAVRVRHHRALKTLATFLDYPHTV